MNITRLPKSVSRRKDRVTGWILIQRFSLTLSSSRRGTNNFFEIVRDDERASFNRDTLEADTIPIDTCTARQCYEQEYPLHFRRRRVASAVVQPLTRQEHRGRSDGKAADPENRNDNLHPEGLRR